jgi:hypothetical protein
MKSGERMDKKMSDAEAIAKGFEDLAEQLNKDELLSDDDRYAILDYWHDAVYEDYDEED